MKRHLWSLAVTLIFLSLAAGSSEPNRSSSSDASVGSVPSPPAQSREEIAGQNVELTSFDWKKGGFDSVMLADFTIRNRNDFPVKDITITCVSSGNSGTEIDRQRKTIFDVVKAKKRRTFHGVNMGFIRSEATRSRCEATGAFPAN
jgi:hypothetical protein